MTNCLSKRCIVSTLAVFAAMVGFNWLYHGHLIMDQYLATASLWRPEGEMQSMMGLCFLKQFLLSAIIAWIFGKHYENRGMQEGLRFGLMIGLLLGVHVAGAYIYMPIPMSLAVAWFVGELLLGLVVGLVLAFVYGRACPATTPSL